jgi:ectoine hydroxylase-related dioxygenase (phytanoyl-CoA dioxygenase family)
VLANLSDFKQTLIADESLADYPWAQAFESNIPVYDGHRLRAMEGQELARVQREWARCWQYGSGVLIVKGLYENHAVVDTMTQVFQQLLDQQSQQESSSGDHFASKGANGRLWNALQKAALIAPEAVVDYYQNPLLGRICEAWLGPDYSLTSQVNLVYPGGQAQQPHRDYHLGFTTEQEVGRYPSHVQVMSSMLTLQGGIAQVDMPLESGPTMLLPYSQRYAGGYSLYHHADFIEYFQQHAVQLPMSKGDGVFFNPALMHAAGANQSADIKRMANLLQVSSAFGKPMESLDHQAMQLACYPALQQAKLKGAALDTIATVLSDAYAFPSNLDRDAPDSSSGLRPLSGKNVLMQALKQGWPEAQLKQTLIDLNWRKSSH